MRRTPHRLDLIFEQRGDTLPGNLRGHEHFGFKDGVSQPGIRGQGVARRRETTSRLATSIPADELDQHPKIFARPGQPLVWPGQFLLGEPRQRPERARHNGRRGEQLPVVGGAGLLPRLPPAQPGRRRLLELRGRSRIARSASPRSTFAADAGGPLAEWRSGDEDARRRQRRSGRGPLCEQPLLLQRRHPPVVPSCRSPATRATPSPRPRRTCSAPSVRTSRTSASEPAGQRDRPRKDGRHAHAVDPAPRHPVRAADRRREEALAQAARAGARADVPVLRRAPSRISSSS